MNQAVYGAASGAAPKNETWPRIRRKPALLALSIAMAAIIGAYLFPTSAIASDKPSLELEKYAGKVVYVDFWASWCAPCRKSFPWMWTMTQRYGAKGFVVITVNLDKNEKLAQDFLAEFPGIGLPVVMDPEAALAKEWKVEAMPTSFLLDRKGKTRYTHRGFLTGETGEYETHIIELVGE